MRARLWIYCPICRGQFDHETGYGRECRCCSRDCHNEFQARYAGMIVGKERDPEEWLREKAAALAKGEKK